LISSFVFLNPSSLYFRFQLPKAAAQAAKTEEKAASTQPSTPLAVRDERKTERRERKEMSEKER